jgi:uncharacterized phage protein (TIGR01671 family)
MQEIKFRFYDPDEHKMFDVLNIEFEGRPSVVLQRRPTIRRPIDLGYLMQFTSMKDKNGVEIYEGDIVECISAYGGMFKAQVVFCDGCFEIKQKRGGEDYFRDYLKCLTVNRAVRVIGNIHENPELVGE